jgi:hypothetical protein
VLIVEGAADGAALEDAAAALLPVKALEEAGALAPDTGLYRLQYLPA